MVMKCNLKKNSKPCVSLKLEKHLLKTGEANSDQKDQGKVTRALPCGSAGNESACNARDLGLIPGSGRSPGEGLATHSSILAWRIPWTEEHDGLQSMGLQKVRHDGVTNTSLQLQLLLLSHSVVSDSVTP